MKISVPPPLHFPVTAALLDADALSHHVLSHYQLTPPVSCVLLFGGRNDTYSVTTGTDRYFLRVYGHGWRSHSHIVGELELLEHLSTHALNVSTVIRKIDDSYLSAVRAPEGVRYAALFSEAPGTIPRFREPDISKKWGSMVACIHSAADCRRQQIQRFHLDLDHLVDVPLRLIAPYLTDRPHDLIRVIQAADILKANISLSKAAPEYGLCHGDLHGANVHIDERGALTVFDFDSCGYGWRAYDAAAFLWALIQVGASAWGHDTVMRSWNAFVAGYSEIRRFSKEELQAIPSFVAIRHIWAMGYHFSYTHKVGTSFLTPKFIDAALGEFWRAIEFTVRNDAEHLRQFGITIPTTVKQRTLFDTWSTSR